MPSVVDRVRFVLFLWFFLFLAFAALFFDRFPAPVLLYPISNTLLYPVFTSRAISEML